MKYLIDDSTLEHELVCAKNRVANAEAILDAAKNHLGYIRGRNAKLGAYPAEPVNAHMKPRLPHQTTLRITSTVLNYNKINAIKAIREFTSLGLKEAKDRVESPLPFEVAVYEGGAPPPHVMKDVPAICDCVEQALTAAGCVITWVD